jgi:hydrogenase maturation factor
VTAPLCPHDGCITCSDEGIEMRVAAAADADGIAPCEDVEGARADVDVLLVEPVEPGDRVLVHARVAIARLQEARA